MKFLFYTLAGESAQFAKKIKEEGNEVKLFIKEKEYSSVFEGLVDKISLEQVDSYIDKDTIIIFDQSGFGKIADNYRKAGLKVFGASSFCDQLEQDRKFGIEFMQKTGIKIPLFEEFTDFNAGKEYVQHVNKRMVFKPSGSMPCKLTYVAEDASDMQVYMKFVEKHFGKEIKSFILQEFIEGAIVSNELFFSNGKVVYPANRTVEVKKTLSGDLGPSTGCQGNITWPTDFDEIIEAGVGNIVREIGIKDEKLTGQIDLNSIITEDGELYGLEWTPRFGYDATPTLLSLLESDLGEFFSDICQGLKEIRIEDKYAGSVRISIPPYPMEVSGKEGQLEKLSPSVGMPIQNWEQHQESLYFYEVMLEDNQLVHSCGSGVIALALGFGISPSLALQDPCIIAEEISIPDKQFRNDLDVILPNMCYELDAVEKIKV